MQGVSLFLLPGCTATPSNARASSVPYSIHCTPRRKHVWSERFGLESEVQEYSCRHQTDGLRGIFAGEMPSPVLFFLIGSSVIYVASHRDTHSTLPLNTAQAPRTGSQGPSMETFGATL